MIPYLRIYEASIINYIKYEVLPLSFTEKEISVPVSLNPDTGFYTINSSMAPSPFSEGRGISIFDIGVSNIVDTTSEQTSQVTVAGPTSYTLDYTSGRILNPNSTPTSVTYNWNYVSVLAGWPGSYPPPLPIVAVDADTSLRSGFQLGGGSKDTFNVSIYVFATSEIEKKDITSIIHDSLFNKSLPVKNWHEGSYLDYGGTFNTAFVPTTVSGIGIGAFKDVTSRLNGPRNSISELNRHRSRITFEFEVLRD